MKRIHSTLHSTDYEIPIFSKINMRNEYRNII